MYFENIMEQDSWLCESLINIVETHSSTCSKALVVSQNTNLMSWIQKNDVFTKVLIMFTSHHPPKTQSKMSRPDWLGHLLSDDPTQYDP